MLRFLTVSIVTVFAFSLLSYKSSAQRDRGGTPGEFDYYTLVMSWSPSYCETEGRGGYDQQCSGMRPYAFVLHGLWPQYERQWPEFCRTKERPWVPQETIDRMLDIMPSPKLVIHEYRKHGTCSGLSPNEYFSISRRLYESIRVPEQFKQLTRPLTASPDEIEQAFLKGNPQLKRDMIEVSCSRNRLKDVRVCFSKDLKPRDCGQNELGRPLCYSNTIVLPPVRGGNDGDELSRRERLRAPSNL